MSARIVEVAAAVLERPDGSFLMARRPEGKAYAGWWEFPGGKLEVGESARQALERELREELGIEVTEAWPWVNRAFVYPHAHVMLRFFRVTGWRGEPHPHEGQALAWTRADPGRPEACHGVSPILPANGPILRGLSLPTEYAISDLAKLGEAAFFAALDARLERGLKLVQLREKHLTGAHWRRVAGDVAARCREQGARLMLNADVALASELGVGVHLSGAQLMAATSRPALDWVAASCHDVRELARAVELDLDFVVLSPVLPTASHPGAATLGWERFVECLRDYPLPVYALGGLTPDDLAMARRHGAHGVALKSQAWMTP
jgi:8-oxo-dGTP diphosphatase